MENGHLFLCAQNGREETISLLTQVCRAAPGCGIGSLWLYLTGEFDEDRGDLQTLMDRLSGECAALRVTLIYDCSMIHRIDAWECKRYARSRGMELLWGEPTRFSVEGEDFVLIDGFGCFEELYEWDWELEEQYSDYGYDPMLAAEDAQHYFLKAAQETSSCPKVIPAEDAAMFRAGYEGTLRQFSELLLFLEPVRRDKGVMGPVLTRRDGWKVRQLRLEKGLFFVTDPEV